MRHYESDQAIALTRWARLHFNTLEGLDLLFHVPNGGSRNAREAGRLKAEGVRPGHPDYLLPYAVAGFRGMAFELKSPKKYPTAEQRWWLARYKREGWVAFVAWEWTAAAQMIADYLRLRLRSETLAPGMKPFENIRMYGADEDLLIPPP